MYVVDNPPEKSVVQMGPLRALPTTPLWKERPVSSRATSFGWRGLRWCFLSWISSVIDIYLSEVV